MAQELLPYVEFKNLREDLSVLNEQEVTKTTENGLFTNSVFFVSFVTSIGKGPVMHDLFRPASELTHEVIGAVNEVIDGISRLILPGANGGDGDN